MKNNKPIIDNTFQKAMFFPISLAQCFSFFPINGVSDATCKSLKFKWRSWRILYSFFTFVGSIMFLLFQLIKIIFINFDLFELNALVFNTYNVIASILFFKMAMEWPDFVKEWHCTENAMKDYDSAKLNLKRDIKILTTIILTLAMIEHFLVNAFKIKSSFDLKSTVSEAFGHFFMVTAYSQIFQFIPYHICIGILLQIHNLISTFLWTFLDIFIMIISTALAFRLKLIAKRLNKLRSYKINDVAIWKTVREDYVRICKLFGKVNENISYLIILSFSANLYFVLVQLFSSLRPTRYTLERLYFYISFGLLILRIVCVCIFGGNVYDATQRMVPILNNCSTNIYNEEVERFLLHLHSCEIAITGRNFFKVKRSLILKIAGAIVTYELVLIQFSGRGY